MEDFKIKADKNIPLHYHLIKVRLNKKLTMKQMVRVTYEHSDFHDGNMNVFTISKRISNL